MIAEGKTLAEATGKAHARRRDAERPRAADPVTTEDPQNNFIPDYGRITALSLGDRHGHPS